VDLRDYQVRAIEQLRERIRAGVRRLLLCSPTGCHARGQRVLMFDGSLRAVEDVRKGERLMGLDSTPRTVLQLCRGRDQMFNIAPTKGAPWIVNGDHVLTLIRTNDGPRGGEIVDVTVREWIGWSRTAKHVHKLFRVGVDFESGALLPIDPYFLGVMLGDGILTRTVGVCKPDPEIKAAVAREAQRWGLRISLDQAGTTSEVQKLVGVPGKPNPLVNALRALGLHGADSGSKFIPNDFKTASRDERLELLAGLVDTDGSLAGGGYDFVSKSRQLSEDVAFLARSLGLAAYVAECQKSAQTGAVGTYHRVTISGDCSVVPCRIPRRRAPPRRQVKDVLRTGFSVEPLDADDFFGFTLDGDQRYLLDDFTVTHNSGKTVMFSSMAESAAARGKRVVVIAHRKELIDQTHAKLEAFGVRAGVVMASDPRFDDYLPVQVCSIQTLARRMDRLPPADLVIYDECHHAVSETSKKVLEAYSSAVLLGATATPWRTDKRGLADLFDDVVVAATPAELIARGALVPYDPFAYDAPDLHDVGLVAGEFNQKELGLACNTDVLVADIVREYSEHAHGRRGLIFPVDIAHSRHLVAEFQSGGFHAEHLDCDTPKDERERIIDGLRSGSVTLVSSVGVLTEGFDAPAAEVCILARPTKSLGLYMQMVGRVLRPSPDTGKARALIHDHAGNLLRHGFPDDDREYSLSATPARVRELSTCPMCCSVFGRVRDDGTCPRCGEVIAPPRAQGANDEPDADAASERKTVDGVRLDRAAIERLRERLTGGGVRRELTDLQVVQVSQATRADKAAEYLRLQAVAERKGFKPGFVANAYRETFGVWPRFKDEDLAGVEPAHNPFLPLPSVAAAARLAGLHPNTVLKRMKEKGLSLEEALSTEKFKTGSPPDPNSISGRARRAGLSVDLVHQRLHMGWTLEQALSCGPGQKRHG